MNFIIADITSNAVILCLILYLVAKHEADYSFAKVAMVTAVIGLVAFLVQTFLFDKIGWFTMAVVFVLATALVKQFCWLRWGKTILVVVLFCACHVGLKIGMAMLKGEPVEQSGVVTKKSIDRNKYKGWNDARKELVLSATMISDTGDYAAMVNGEIVEVGDIVSVPDDSIIYRWKVDKISKHAIEYIQLRIDTK
jgi:hypothetical protein